MALRCNIDSRGRVARLIYGIIMVLAAAVVLLVWALPTGSVWSWVVTASLAAAGAFGMFEARAGWCAVRAMGFKTPM
jgi:hypothetical protein